MFTISAYTRSNDGYQLVSQVHILAPLSAMKLELRRFEKDLTWQKPWLICKYIVTDKSGNILHVQPE